MIQIYRRIINFGKKTSLLSPTLQNLASDVVQHVERPRDRWVNPEEMPRLLKAINNVENIYIRATFWLYLLTGVRKMELLNITWDDVDVKRRTITLHDTKNGERRALPLAGPALELIQKMARVRRRIDTRMVFPGGKDPSKPINIRDSWEKALEAAEIEDFRFHDLRHSTASYLAMDGASLAEIAEVLGHKTLQMVKRYAHLSEQHTAGVVAHMNEKIFGR